jgi:chromosome segregation and condensation protein ScpB
MNRADVAVKLLAHGPMTRGEFIAVTGWPVSTCLWVIGRLRDRGLVRLSRAGRTAVWSLIEGKEATQ